MKPAPTVEAFSPSQAPHLASIAREAERSASRVLEAAIGTPAAAARLAKLLGEEARAEAFMAAVRARLGVGVRDARR